MTTIAALPTPPARSRPGSFATEADAFIGALPGFVTQTNALAGELNAAAAAAADSAADSADSAATGTAATNANKLAAQQAQAAAELAASSAINAPGTSAQSTSAVTVALGAVALAIQPGKSFAYGQRVVITRTADPSRWLAGQITAHNPATGALSVAVDLLSVAGQSETWSDWTIALTGATGNAPSFNPFVYFALGLL